MVKSASYIKPNIELAIILLKTAQFHSCIVVNSQLANLRLCDDLIKPA